MDNKLFNVNGRSFLQFKRTLELILTDEYEEEGKERVFGFSGSGIRGFRITKKKGIILYWHLDAEYLGYTEDIHTMSIQSDEGNHIVTIVDQDGNSTSQNFEIVQ